jgi:3-dehydroquinate dehydratase II
LEAFSHSGYRIGGSIKIKQHYSPGDKPYVEQPLSGHRPMSDTIYVLNGPNLNLLGVREPHLYGSTTLAQVEQLCRRVASEVDLQCEFRQTNHEGVLVDWVQEAREKAAAVVINPAGLSFRSIPLLDALKTLNQPIAEVHITNIHQRDTLYQTSLVSLAATGVICGFGPFGYELAIRALAQRLVATAT